MAATVRGQTNRTWTGAVNSDWFNAGNWVPSGVPATNDILNVNSGTINLTAPVTIAGQLNWSGGSLNGNGLAVTTNGAVNLLGSGSVALYVPLTNAGTINWSNTVNFYIGNNNGAITGGVYNLAGALFNIQSDQTVIAQFTSPFVYNAGTISKGAGTGNTTIGVPFTNNGVVTVLKGTLNLNSGGDIDATFNASAGATVNFNSGSFSYNTPPTLNGPGTFQLTGGNLTLVSNTIPNLQFVGGTLALGAYFQGGSITNLTLSGANLNGNNTVSGLFNWAAGNLNGTLQIGSGGNVNWSGGTALGAVNVATGGALNLVGNGSVALYAPLTNAGTINWSNSVNLYVGNNNAAYTGAVYNQAGALFNIQSDQSLVGQYSFPFFDNEGTVSKGANSGTTTIGIVFTNNGIITVSRGTVNFNAGGQLGGTYNASSGATINFNNGAFSYNTPPVLNGPGTIQLSGSGTLTLVSNTIPNLTLTGGTITLGNNFQGGTITNLTIVGATLSGSYTVTGTFNCGGGVSGNLLVANGAVLNWSGGNIFGTLQVADGAAINWSGGSAYSAVNIGTNGTLNLIGGGGVGLYAPLTNAGTINWSNTVTFYVGNNSAAYSGAIFNLAGALFNIQSDQSLVGQYNSPFFNNAGSMIKGTGTGTTTFGVAFTNSGIVTVLKGTLNLNAGGRVEGTFNAAAGAVINFNSGGFSFGTAPIINGPGLIEFTGGTLALLNDVVPNLVLAGGTVTVGPNFQGGTITNFTSSSTLSGSFTVGGVFNCGGGVTGNIAVNSGATLNFSGGTIGGTLTLLSNSIVNWSGGNVNGSIQLPGTAVVNWSGGSAYSAVNIATNGTLNLIGGGGVGLYAPLTNAGTINWSNTVTFYVGNNNAAYTGGIFNLAGALFNIQSDQSLVGQYNAPFFNNAGTVLKGAGAGTTTMSVAFTNSNILDVETGVLRFNSSFAQSAGSWSIGLNGSANYGQVTFNGNVALNGQLNVHLNGSYVPSLNTSFAVVGYGSHTGTFGSVTPPADGLFWQINYGAGSVSLQVTNYVAPTIAIATPTNGAAFITPANITLTATTTDSNAAVTNVQYFQGATLVGQASTSPYTVAWNNVPAGFYTLTARATDSVGAAANSPPININVYSPVNPSTNFFWVGGLSTDWFNAGNWLPAGVPGLFDSVNITNSVTVTLSTNVTVSSFNFASGTLNGSGSLTISNTMNWSGGTMAVPLTVLNGASLNLNGAGTVTLQAGLTNAGTVNWLSGQLSAYYCSGPGGAIINLPGGTWNIRCDQTLSLSCGNAYFQNAGTIQKSTTPGSTTFSIPFFNSNQVSAVSGTLVFNGGGTIAGNFNVSGSAGIQFYGGNFTSAAASITGAGSAQFNGGNLTLPSDIIQNLALTGGTVILGSNFQGGTITNLTLAGSTLAGTNIVTGTLSWAGGTIAGPLMIAGAGVLNLNSSSLAHLGGSMTNAGTVNWLNGGLDVNGCSGGPAGPIINLPGGVWNVLCDQTMSQSCGGASTYFQNAGTVQKSGTTGATTLSIAFNNSGLVSVLAGTLKLNGGGTIAGTLNAATGAALNLTSGNFTSSGAVINGPGAVQLNGGTLTLLVTAIPNLGLNGGTVALDPAFEGGTITNLTLSGSTLVGTNLVTGFFNWLGGTIAGPLTVASTGVLNLSGGGTAYLNSALTNAGLVNWTSGNVSINGCSGQAGPIVNLVGSLWSIQCDQTLGIGCSSTNGYFQNAGTVEKSGSMGTTVLSLPFYNSGTLAPQNGTIYFNTAPGYASTGATLDFEVNNLSTAGHLAVAGNINFDGTLVVNALGAYVPSMGDALSLVGYGSLSGSINSLSLPPLLAGLAWQLSYTPSALLLQVVSSASFSGQITGSVTDNLGHAVTNLTVFAYSTNSPAIYVSTQTDSNGNYVLNAAGGNWLVGLQGLPARGYNNVPDQNATVSGVNPVVNFVLQPFSGQTYTITTAVNPAGAGTASGGGTFAPGSTVTVVATANTSTLPWLFVNWTENSVFESASSSYSFTATRDRQLVANFSLPLYTVSVTNLPSGAGSVTGAGSYYYGTTNVLTAHPNFGYNFGFWSEAGVNLGSTPSLTNVIYTNHLFTANYTEANVTHVVATATSPSGLAAIAGAGTYANGQTANFSAPRFITNAPYVYSFQQFTVSNIVVSASPAFSKTFSTLDQTNLLYVAVYSVRTILPIVAHVNANLPNPVPITTNFQVSVQFDRSMQTTVAPLLLLTNSAASVQPTVPGNGTWSTTALANDTYTTPAITLGTGMDGTNQLYVSGGQDLNGNAVALTNAGFFIVDATPPLAPVLSIISSNNGTVQVGWSTYVAPNDLSTFRVFLQTTNFSSVGGLPILTGLGAAARSVQVSGLSLDTPYYIAVQAVDQAGNGSTVNTLPITLASSVPPPVSLQESAVGASSAAISWNSYNTANFLGFAGFQLYYQQTNFTSVAGMTPNVLLDANTHSYQVDGLDRTKTNYFAVVGFNIHNAFNPNVSTVSWTDPYAGNISVNTTIGGNAASVMAINQSMTVVNNATLTIRPGTTLLFAPGTSITVQTGGLVANGTALAPITFDSANDTPGSTPAPGDWRGVLLGTGASGSSLRFVQLFYSAGLTISGCAPTVQAFTASYNYPYGLGLQNAATLSTSDALLTGNYIGAQQSDTAVLTIVNSVLRNNGTNAFGAGFSPMLASSNWWGTTVQTTTATGARGNITFAPILSYEPVLTPALGTVDGITQVGTPSVNLALACRNATAMRVSEDDTFPAVFFAPFTNVVAFPLSAGGGVKRIYAQYRSVTGQTNTPVELDITYITAGPTIQSFSLIEGQVLSRPITVTGSATAPLGMADMEFYLDGVLVGSNPGGNLSQYLDVRTLANAIHRVELLARDSSGHIATLANNVIVSVTPPPAPLITSPASDYTTNNAGLTVSGTAEPGIGLQLTDNGQILGTTNANVSGSFSFTNLTLSEGANALIAVASDSTGTTPSGARQVTVSTIPPAAVVMNAPVYTPGAGLAVSFQFATTGKRPTSFEVFWANAPFPSTNQATGHSIVLQTMAYTLQALANGTYYFGVVGFDAAGNASPLSGLVSTIYDATPPSLSLAYGTPSPVGVGTVVMTLSSDKALAGTPMLTIRPFGAPSPILLNLTNVALNTYQTAFAVTANTPSGVATLNATAQDQSGNVFNGPPAAVPLIVDTTPPAANIVTVPAGPVQTVNGTNVSVGVALTKLAGSGTTPTLSFAPPTGSSVVIPLSGSGTNWNGTLPLTSAMGSGFGKFTFSALDGVGNLGTNILTGAQLELYNTVLPAPPAAPTNLVAKTLAGGFVQLNWQNVSNAQIYRLYREPGTSLVPPPAVLVLDNIMSNNVTDLPPSDGSYRYGVTASRLGSESGISNVVIGVSDRTPPLAPTNVIVTLAASGVLVTWQEPSGGDTPDHYNIYRNGTLLRTVSSTIPVVDYPPRGTNNYVVSAADAAGNENSSLPTAMTLLVGAVNSLAVSVTAGQAPQLTWASTDATAVGFNIYRNGIKQNASLITANNYTDSLPMSDVVQYAVTAVNASAQESPPRLVSVYPVGLGLLVNSLGSGTNNPLLRNYFDQLQVTVTNLSAASPLSLAQVQITRSISGQLPLVITQSIVGAVNPGATGQQFSIIPEAPLVASQTFQVQAFQVTDSSGSTVSYSASFTINNSQLPGTEIAVSVNQLPLAGGVTPFQVQIYNRGYADIQIIVSRGFGAHPGDVFVAVQNAVGQEVSRTTFQGTPSGTFFLPDGTGYINIPVGSSSSFTIPQVLVPAALAGSTNTTFVAVAGTNYNGLGTANPQMSGPLIGSMVSSSLALPPYYGTAQTDKPGYANTDPILITGQALNQSNGVPVPNAALNIGFATRGFHWFQGVTTDSNGNYQYTFNPPAGFGGTLAIWAAHPLVVDQLNQVVVTVYRLYSLPPTGDIVMSKNGTIDFTIQLFNPGDVALTGLATAFNAYQVSGTNLTPINTITGTNMLGSGFTIAPSEKKTITLHMAAAINAPDSAETDFTFTSAEGASVTFSGSTTLLPAVPVLSVVNPPQGYLEVSVNRGSQLSGQITVKNTGLRALQGITLNQPSNSWMTVNLPASSDGQIHLPDLDVGQSNTFTVVFTPPTNTDLAFYQDSVTFQGTNTAATFSAGVYALVTSDQMGAVQFFVDDILGSPVPNAAVRLHSNVLFSDPPAVYTDTNGLVTVTNLQEGTWNWQVVAAGCSGTMGTIDIVADQTAYQHTRLSRSLVTVTFNVVPVPFSDQYQIQVEQTFQTHVPAGVLVVDPPFLNFPTVTPGFQANFTATVENYGLIQMTDVTITGAQINGLQLTPLITYIPVLLPMQSVTVPFVLSYNPSGAPATGIQTRQVSGDDIANCIAGGFPFGGLVDPAVFQGLAAIMNAQERCYTDLTPQQAGAALGILAGLGIAAGSFAEPLEVLANYLGSTLGCIVGQFLNFGGGTSLIEGGGPAEPTSGPTVAQGNGCFSGETLVLMSDGTSKPISEIRTNDVVRTGPRPDKTAEVNAVFTQTATSVRDISITDAAGIPRKNLIATDEHLFWVDNMGWTAVANLRSGDWLFDSSGNRLQVTRITRVRQSRRVYTLSLSGDNAFYANNVLVRDACGIVPPVANVRLSEVVK